MNAFERPSPASVGAALEVKKRRELAVSATEALSEIFEARVSIRDLLTIADVEEDSPARLTARRALRAVYSVSREDSEIARRLRRGDVYHYVEGVVEYGASTSRYLELMDACQLNPEETTGLYSLREMIAEYTDGWKPGFQYILEALAQAGVSVQHAALDPEHALAAFDEAGFFVDHESYKVGNQLIVAGQFDRPKFRPAWGNSAHRIVEDDTDGSITEGINESLKEGLRHPVEESDVADENQVWREEAIAEYLKNLGS